MAILTKVLRSHMVKNLYCCIESDYVKPFVLKNINNHMTDTKDACYL